MKKKTSKSKNMKLTKKNNIKLGKKLKKRKSKMHGGVFR